MLRWSSGIWCVIGYACTQAKVGRPVGDATGDILLIEQEGSALLNSCEVGSFE